MADRQLGGPGFDVVEKARAAISRYRMLQPEDRVLVALSGGPDSTCLLDVLLRLSSQQGYVLTVAHVDHGLSEESETIAMTVARAVAEAGLEVHIVRAPDLAGPNLHARARDFRYSFFETIAAQWGATRIATGHTLDDRVETTVARLIHGAGTTGLAGIPPVDNKRIRPLIGVRRSETRAYCDDNALTYFDDPANDDDRFERVAVRKEVLAEVEERWGEGAIRAMAVSSDRLWEDARALGNLADRLYEGLANVSEERVSFALDVILETPRAFRRRLLERAVGRLRDRSGVIDAALDALETHASGSPSFSGVGGTEIEIADKEVVVHRATTPPDQSTN
jgi:tRNA(Ile)-lysidine synthase